MNLTLSQILKSTIGTCINKFAAVDPASTLSPAEIERSQAARERRRTTAAATSSTNRSTGPTTPEGKLRAAQNARKHGFSGASMVISDEDRPAYDAHLDHYFRAFNPQNQPQADAVRLAANALWRIDRLTVIETHLLDLEVAWNSVVSDAKLQDLTPGHHLAIAFLQHTAGSNAMELCRRYISSADRDYQRAVDTFAKLKKLTTATPVTEVEAPPAPAAAPEVENEAPAAAAAAQPEPTEKPNLSNIVPIRPNELPLHRAERPSPDANPSQPPAKAS